MEAANDMRTSVWKEYVMHTVVSTKLKQDFAEPTLDVLPNHPANMFAASERHLLQLISDSPKLVDHGSPMSTPASSTTASPTSLPPVTKAERAPERPFFSNTEAMIFVVAMAHNEVLGAGFQTVALPAASDSDRFLQTFISHWLVDGLRLRTSRTPPLGS
jgi:hypothetical protein